MLPSHRLPDGHDADLPLFTVGDDGTVTWRGEPLRFKHLKEIVYAVRASMGLGWNEPVDSAKPRWHLARKLVSAVILRLPSDKILDQAVETLPSLPDPPEKPMQKNFLKVDWNPRSLDLDAYERAMVNWKKDMDTFQMITMLHEAHLGEMQERVKNWKRFGGYWGIEMIRRERDLLYRLLETIEQRLDHPELLHDVLPFELLPPGLWNFERLMVHLGGRHWRVQQIVPERVDHLFALNPLKVYEGNMHRDYREYFIFIFQDDGSAVLESPFHGNATYLLRSDWFSLCQKTKSELFRDSRATRIIHHDMTSWRRDMCRLLNKQMPTQSNDY
jgi:hypothetical protein